MTTMDWLTVLTGDCRDILPTLPAESVNCVVTSPPYWGLRSYGVGTENGELGLEPTPEEYVANLVGVFREVRRVLRADGTVWLNLGDSYAANGVSGLAEKGESSTLVGTANSAHTAQRKTVPYGLKPKDLVGIPWRVAFALQADGWYLRSDIIWSKPNPMPESVTDRPTKAHEYVFLLTKSARYWYDADAVREAYVSGPVVAEATEVAPKGTYDTHGGYVSRGGSHSTPKAYRYAGRNLRSVWTIATQPYPGAHFAVFPEALAERCILAGCPDQTCSECGAPWERVVERIATVSAESFADGSGHVKGSASDRVRHLDGKNYVHVRGATLGFRPTCAHDTPSVPGVVLDCFAGTGTVGLVANRLSRRAVLIDLNPEYIGQLRRRNRQAPLGLVASP